MILIITIINNQSIVYLFNVLLVYINSFIKS